MRTSRKILLIASANIFILNIIFFSLTPGGRSIMNKWERSLIEADLDTNYQDTKMIEDTLRSYAASYEADKITYETYKDLDDQVSKDAAIAAKIRANRTAASYNEFYLKNSHIWKDRVPDDIKSNLEYLK